mmetsp:Transcript_38530/g.46566  ORF Transcript_38530/g.46566 Transcript_38530/m.46566 type:complete len:908 (-) Transcript_38530:403-3126(-)|eukprot:CAMPEP_0197852570 /NCGR_PEP_ID=MMETSP1438-20131217/20949_1 /TAXON_ID=1461541 /ORGANISM="Pterosperma sp., Strain CCMP1384" /LENGTH=907 /DNA_ID=CAMNT_0043466685 /DNA_START=118 /DNA_END=2841 /DNA_ORIENTATION=+
MAQEHRSFDSLYDTTYTVSGPRDHYREQSRAAGFLLERVPEYVNFFSELPTHPSQTYRFKANDKLPNFVSRDFLYDQHFPPDAYRHHQADVGQVSGENRYKYFRRPMLPPGPVATLAPVEPPPPPVEELPPGTKVTMGTQSDYRESEAQTLPYAPDYVLPDQPSEKQRYLSERNFMPDGVPEVLTLQHFKYTDGLPPGLAEVEMVEKQRAKRAFEASLPPLSDTARLPLRQQMMEEWEKKEWEERETEIKGLQDERLEVLQRAIAMREAQSEARAQKRIEDMKNGKLSQKQKAFAAIQAKRIKALRKLSNGRKQVEAPELTIVDDYGNYGSKVYAPTTRHGQFPDLKPRGLEVDPKPFEPANYREYVELEQAMPKKSFQMQPPVIEKGKPANAEERAKAAVAQQLGHIDSLLLMSKEEHNKRGHGECWPEPLEDKEAKSSRKRTLRGPERPETPSLAADPAAASRRNAIVLLQKLLRGRAVQNNMFEGKQKRLELIKELQLEDGLPSEEMPALPGLAEQKMDQIAASAIVELLKILTVSDPQEQAKLLLKAEEKRLKEEREEQERAAIRIQAQIRGRQTRKNLSKKGGDPVAAAAPEFDFDPTEAEQAALKIQAVHRGRIARKEVQSLRGQGSSLRQQMLAKAAEDLPDLDAYTDEMKASVVKIQANARGMLTRKQTKKKPGQPHTPMEVGLPEAQFDEEQEAAVLKIQSAARGRQARKQVQSMKSQKEAPASALPDLSAYSEEEKRAILRIQTNVRGVQARDYVKKKRADAKQFQDMKYSVEDELAIIKIQAATRGHKSRKELKKGKMQAKQDKKAQEAGEDVTLMDLSDPEMEKAAIKIQAKSRGFLARKKVGGKKKNEPKINKFTGRVMTPQESDEEKAVVKIQAGVRGRMARKRVDEIKKSKE